MALSHLKNLLLLLLCFETQANICTTPTFINSEITVVKYANFSYIPIKIEVTGCITPEVIANQLGSTNARQLECVNQSVPVLHELAVAHFPDVFSLTISYSGVREIKSSAFVDLPELSSVDLSDNDITTIHKGAFANLLLENLDLSNNKLTSLEPGVFDLPKIMSLALEDNKLTAFEPDWLAPNFHFLDTVYLNGNNIHSIYNDTFNFFKNLEHIDLGFNRIHHIDKDAFSELKQLSSLYLNNNRITKIDRDLLQSNKELSVLWLHSNNITYLSEKTLSDLPGLFQITVHTNPWQCGCYNKIVEWVKSRSTFIILGTTCYNDNNPACVYSRENKDLCLEHRDEELVTLYYKLYDFDYDCD